VEVEVDERGVATVTLNRPEVRNVIGKQLIADMRTAVAGLKEYDGLRCVVLTGAGDAFCAGGDLRWMHDNMGKPRDEQIRETTALAEMLQELDEFPALVIGKINGAAYGGGLGLVSVCDIAIGAESAQFALTEVRLGLAPATISPYVVARMGLSNARRTMLNANRYDAATAVAYGLLHLCVPDSELDRAVEKEIELLLRCGPGAVAMSKALVRFVNGHELEESKVYTANCLADAWETDEGQEGIECFFAKKSPSWVET
jgi:methylglutaconyl-CoA hydratase